MELVLKQVRERSGMTQQQVANAIGIKVATYRTWEQGSVKLTLENAYIISDVLGCTPNDLCDWYATHPREGDAPASQGERRLVSAYGALSEEGREVAENVVTGLLATYPQRPDTDELGETA